MGSLGYSEEPHENMHVLMVSFPGQGHVNPLLRLGKRLASSGLFVTLTAPEFIGQSIKKANKITNDQPTPIGKGMIRFEFFDDGWDFNDPNRTNLDAYLDQLEQAGREKLPIIIRKQAEMGRPICCVINNPFIPWATDVAETLGIPTAMLWVQSCACFLAYYHYYHKLVKFPSLDELEIDVGLPSLPLLKYDEVPSFLHPTTPYPFLGRAILGQFKNIDKAFAILVDSFYELERDSVEYMKKIYPSIKTIGPLFRSCATSANSSEITGDLFAADNCVDWLDSKPEGSVVYISFGSIVHLKQEQVDEIAYGLLNSGINFLWVLRPPPKEHENRLKPHILPEGFLDKVGDKGKILQWSSQEAVLSHSSIACFVTHCGWNSTIEALTCGVPVVAFPQWGDQVTDAKFLVDVYKVGVGMCRGEAEDRIVPRGEVERCLTAAIESKELKENALTWKKLAEEAVGEGGSSFKNVQDFVDEIVRIGDKGLAIN